MKSLKAFIAEQAKEDKLVLAGAKLYH